MISTINTFYSNIINIGVDNTLNSGTKKKVRLLNVYATIWLHLIFIFILSDYLGGILKLSILGSHVVGFFVMLSVYKLHKLKKHNTAKTIWLVYAIIHFFLLSSVFSKGWFIEFYFLLIPCFSLSLYNNLNVSRAILILSVFLFLYPAFISKNYPDLYVEQLKVPSILGIFGALFMLVLYYKKLNLKNENELLKDKKILQKQHKELKQLNEFKSHFFVNLSHEIRTPLTLIQGHASQINLNAAKDKTQEHINVIKSQSEQINDIINNILDLSKIDTNEFRLKTEYTDVSNFLNKHYTNFKELFNSKGITFSILNNSESLAFKVDDYMFSKSINNLLTNSLKFTPLGGTVTLKAFLENQNLIIELYDTGIGIPQKDINRIFDRFFQSKNHITKSQGSGIGLSFTKSIIEAHNFSIDVKSNPNIATTFSIKIPKSALQKSKSTHQEPTIKKSTTSKTKPLNHFNSNRKILIVEDHPQMLDYISSLLNTYNVVTAKNGKEALNILKTNTFDAIITDYMMPIMDGETLVGAIKKQNIKTPVLVLTARTDNEGKLKMLRLGIDGYLNKPFMKEELFIYIKKAFQSYDIINQFDKKLDKEEKEHLNKFAQKFNDNLNRFIMENMHTSNFGIESVAEHLNISKSTLNRKTKSLLGQTPKDIIIEARLQKAKKLLEENPTETQKNIAKSVGISNTSYFFKKMEERFYTKV